MKAPFTPKRMRSRWFTSHQTIVVFTALGLLLLVVQINKVITSSFRIELFGVEVLEVNHLNNTTPVEDLMIVRERRPFMRVPLAPVPPHTFRLDHRESTDPFVVVEEMPTLIGGLSAVQDAIRYPEIARRAGVEGRVIVQFVVDEEGRVTEPQIIRGIGGGCDQEALRVVRQIRFQPGKQHGRPVKVRMSLPVIFRLP